MTIRIYAVKTGRRYMGRIAVQTENALQVISCDFPRVSRKDALADAKELKAQKLGR